MYRWAVESSYTTRSAEIWGISFEEAEALKISAACREAKLHPKSKDLAATHDGVAEEIRRTFDFYTALGQSLPFKKFMSVVVAAERPAS